VALRHLAVYFGAVLKISKIDATYRFAKEGESQVPNDLAIDRAL